MCVGSWVMFSEILEMSDVPCAVNQENVAVVVVALLSASVCNPTVLLPKPAICFSPSPSNCSASKKNKKKKQTD